MRMDIDIAITNLDDEDRRVVESELEFFVHQIKANLPAKTEIKCSLRRTIKEHGKVV